MIVDTHTHAWGPPSQDQPWVTAEIIDDMNSYSVDLVYTARKLLTDMDKQGIDRAVVVDYPTTDYRDSTYTQQVVAEHDRLDGIVVIDPFADESAQQLRAAMAVDGIVGVRLGVVCPRANMWRTFDPSVSWLSEAIDCTEFWEAAIETDAIVQLLADETQLEQTVELVDSYPSLRYLFDHFAHTDPDTPPEQSAFGTFAELADYDGVCVKLSEIQHRSDEAFPYRDMHDHVAWFLEQFGRERVLWGSDFPNVSDVAAYNEALHWLDHVECLSRRDRNWITGRTYESLTG